MKLTIEDIIDDLKATANIIKDKTNISLVAHIGNATRPIGEYMSNTLNCDLTMLPSLNRKGKNNTIAKVLNNYIYPFAPENLLRFAAESYKRIYAASERVISSENEYDAKIIADYPSSGILLVDDNSLTGKTFEIWKKELNKITARPIFTFSVAVSGDYKPDYFCYDHWCSFEWRPIGI